MSEGDRPRPPFDPWTYLRDGTLDVHARLVWLRHEHPDARIVTEHVVLDEQQAVFRAAVERPSGGHATGYGSATRSEGADFIERAEEKAIDRALVALGYGSRHGTDAAASATPPVRRGEREQPSPPAPTSSEPPAELPSASAPTNLVSARASRSNVPRSEPAPELESPPQAQPPAQPQARVRAVPREPASDSPTALRSSSPGRVPPADEEGFVPADYNWTDFWRWARPLGYIRRTDLDQLLGVDTNALTPKEVRRMLQDFRREHGQPD